MSFPFWDRLRVLFRDANIFRQERIYQDQTDLARATIGDQIIDITRQQALLEQTNLQINRLERYKDFDQMDETGEITLALDIYADETSLVDPETSHAIQIKAKSERIKKELEYLFYETLLIDSELRPLVRYLCKYGDLPAEIIPTMDRDAVQALRHINVYNFTRLETKHGDLIGFFFQDQLTASPVFLHPWQVMHVRLTSLENIYHPYGRSILDGARKDFKRLRLMEDAALIYRITRAPEKRIFSIPVGNIPPREVPQYIELIARQFKKRKFVDPATGNVNERYSPLIQEDDFFLPKRMDGQGPTIDTLPGAENLDAIADIEYFKKNMISALKIPFNRVGIGEQRESDGKTLAAVAPEFAKAVQWIQRQVAMGFKKVAIVHLALKGYPVNEIRNFDIHMTAASAIDELYRIETWMSRANVIAQLMETGLFDAEWVLDRFTDLSEDEVKRIQARKKKELERIVPPTGGVPGLPEETELTGDEEMDKLILEQKELEEEAKKTDRLLQETMKQEEEEQKWSKVYAKLINDHEIDGLRNGRDEYLVDINHGEDVIEQVKAETCQLLLTYDEDAEVVSISKGIDSSTDTP